MNNYYYINKYLFKYNFVHINTLKKITSLNKKYIM